jgi:hypothetical protein
MTKTKDIGFGAYVKNLTIEVIETSTDAPGDKTVSAPVHWVPEQ